VIHLAIISAGGVYIDPKTGKIANPQNATPITPAPTWQDKLTSYKTDTASAEAEIARAKQVYNTKMASGDIAGANSAHVWANQIRDAQGLKAGTDYDAKTGSVIPKVETAKVETPKEVVPPTTSYINKIYDAQQNANIQKFYDARNQASAQNAQQARNFAEFMASRGNTSSGANAQAELSRNSVYQGNLTSLNNQQIQEANAIDANKANALRDQFNTDRQVAIQEAGLTGNYNGQRTLAGSEADWAKNENNPAYAKSLIDLQISKIDLKNYPAVQQAQIAKLQNDVETGKVSLKTAQYQLGELTNPNSVTNQTLRAGLAKATEEVNTQKSATAQNWAQTNSANASAGYYNKKASAVGVAKPKTASDVDKSIKTQFTVLVSKGDKGPKGTTYVQDKTGVTDLVARSGMSSPTEARNLLGKYGVDAVTVGNYLKSLNKSGLTNEEVTQVQKSLGYSDKEIKKALGIK
jgi:hypothetical protein